MILATVGIATVVAAQVWIARTPSMYVDSSETIDSPPGRLLQLYVLALAGGFAMTLGLVLFIIKPRHLQHHNMPRSD